MASVSKWKHEDTGFVCLFVWKRDGRKAGGGDMAKKQKKWIKRADQTYRLKKGSIGLGNRMIQNDVFFAKEKAMEKLMAR